MGRKPRLVAERFWEKVQRGPDCWIWIASKNVQGYGRFSMLPSHKSPKSTGAHRAAWILTNGPISDGMDVLHRCDNPACVRPDHLFLGNQSDNMNDMYAKHPLLASRRTYARGERNGRAKLTREEVWRIRLLATSGTPQKVLAQMFQTDYRHLRRIVRRESWGHV